ncbi:hypothetical protein BV20DRAFT_971966 [Pilatotrama ljubarskyi]|nr:hypothetical protein BV20DRAFT_971966 [Pilatotrama ljubarskyi]
MRIRNRGGEPDNTYQWADNAGPSRIDWASNNNENIQVVPDPPKGFPDVPLNVDHRYCTPPPLDPRYIEESVGPKDDFPPYHGRASSPSNFEGYSDQIQMLPPLGTFENPYVIEDDDNARQYRQTLPPPPGLENHGPRRTASNNRQSAQAVSSSSSSSTSMATTSSSRGTTSNARAGPSTQEPPIARSERYRKTAADGFTPKMPSPLKKLAYKAPSPVVPPMPDSRWQIPPRKHSTSPVTVLSVSSSDSEYECD